MALQRLIYVSKVGQHVRLEDAEAIAAHSAKRNALDDITGFLLYTPEHFVQVLEGEASKVDAVYERIRSDPRHSDVRTLSSEPTAARRFSEWSMGFAFLQQIFETMPGENPSNWNAQELLERMEKAAG